VRTSYKHATYSAQWQRETSLQRNTQPPDADRHAQTECVMACALLLLLLRRGHSTQLLQFRAGAAHKHLCWPWAHGGQTRCLPPCRCVYRTALGPESTHHQPQQTLAPSTAPAPAAAAGRPPQTRHNRLAKRLGATTSSPQGMQATTLSSSTR
jgi:hypothetical protein